MIQRPRRKHSSNSRRRQQRSDGRPAMNGAVLISYFMLLMAADSTAAEDMRQICNATVDVTDSDPAGTHVRSTPGGAVIATLKSSADGWVSVRLIAQLGDWYEIDTASLVDNIHPATLFRGKGYVHKSVLGVSGLQNGATLYIDPDGKQPIVSQLAGDQRVTLLGCRGPFLKVKAGEYIGWTKEVCTNMNTTCV